MPREDQTDTEIETRVEKPSHESAFDRLEKLDFMNGTIQFLPYSKLGHEVFDNMWDKVANILPVYALGHNDPEVRRLANELFDRLYLNRELDEK